MQKECHQRGLRCDTLGRPAGRLPPLPSEARVETAVGKRRSMAPMMGRPCHLIDEAALISGVVRARGSVVAGGWSDKIVGAVPGN